MMLNVSLFALNTYLAAMSYNAGSTGWALFSLSIAGLCAYQAHRALVGPNDK